MTRGIILGAAIIPRGGIVLIIGVGAVGMPAGTTHGMTPGGARLGDGVAGMPAGIIIILIIGAVGIRIIIMPMLRRIIGTDVPDIPEVRDVHPDMPAIYGVTVLILPDAMPEQYGVRGVMPGVILQETRPLCVAKV